MMYICTYEHFVDSNDMIGGTMENLKRIPVFVPKEHAEELREIAHKERTSVSEEVRKAVAEYLERKREGK
jgi:metal-responsive CopG/Arc/MetJ family transcriptional regulator